MARLDDAMSEAFRTWCRLAEVQEIIAVLEIIREELAARHIVLAFTTEYRGPGAEN
jgi:hypothetical protein